MFKAEIIADSLSPYSTRLTTFVVTFPRFILAEFNTHRMLSRNSASSRAIPFKKMLDAVLHNPFIPMKWMKDHSGMQGTEYFEDEQDIISLNNHWKDTRYINMDRAQQLHDRGVSKQIVNRLLEPYMWHTVIVTGTEWENFFALRADPAAEIHMQHLAELMLKEYNDSLPTVLQPGEWHLPYGDHINDEQTADILVAAGEHLKGSFRFNDYIQLTKIKIATARCAQVSYTVVGEEGKPLDYPKLIKLHDRLASMGHWSPFEHCAKVMDKHEYYTSVNGGFTNYSIVNIKSATIVCNSESTNFGWSGNFRGFTQYRKTFKDENRSDNRVKKYTYESE